MSSVATQFKPGQSGNPNGRAKGTKNKATLARADLHKLIIEAGPRIVEKAIEMAEKENETMIRLLIDKILPSLKSTTISGDKENPVTFVEVRLPKNPREVEKDA